MLKFFTILHPLVDACSVTVLVSGGMTWERLLAYNALAFALEFPLGIALDRWSTWWRGCFAGSLALVLVGVVLCACGLNGWAPLALACIGNALFHLTVGKHMLETHKGKSGPIGLFISTGAVGLFAGMKLADAWTGTCCAGFGGALAVVGAMAVWRIDSDVSRAFRRIRSVRVVSDEIGVGNGCRIGWVILFGLFALIAWRSWAGLLASGMTNAGTIAFACAGVALTGAGKVVGGYLGDRFGWGRVTGVSVAGSLALCFLCRPEQRMVWLALLFVAQLATGPVLSLVYERTGRRGGTAFGINCLGLFTGSLA